MNPKNPKEMLIIMLTPILLIRMFKIIKHCYDECHLQEKIYTHSEIINRN